MGVADIQRAAVAREFIDSQGTQGGTTDALLVFMQTGGIRGTRCLCEAQRSKVDRQSGVSLRPSAILLAVLLSFIALGQAQTTGALHLSSPANDSRLDGRMVIVEFELSPGVSANGIPTFRVQLDQQSPALTTDTECILYWIPVGWHTVTVSLVDANGTPIFGVQSQVQFEVTADDVSAAIEPFTLHIPAGRLSLTTSDGVLLPQFT